MSGPNYALWQTQPLSKKEFSNIDDYHKYTHLSLCGHLAASTHNSQSWAFKISSDTHQIGVYLDRGALTEDEDHRRVLPESDVVGRQSTISVGCAITNIIIAAKYFSYEPDVTYVSVHNKDLLPIQDIRDNQRYCKLATISLQKDSSQNNEYEDLYKAIFERRVHRGKYKEKSLSEEVINHIKTVAQDHNIGVHIFTNKSLKQRLAISGIARLQSEADAYVASHDGFAKELGDWLLPNDTQSYLGMPGHTFWLDDKTARRFHKGLLREENLLESDISGFAEASERSVGSAPLIAMLSVEKDIPHEWIDAGRVLEHVGVFLRKNGIAYAVQAGLAEVEFFRKPVSLFIGKKKPVILFRAGYAEQESTHSPRLPIEDVLIT
jgi:hypothetical protein